MKELHKHNTDKPIELKCLNPWREMVMEMHNKTRIMDMGQLKDLEKINQKSSKGNTTIDIHYYRNIQSDKFVRLISETDFTLILMKVTNKMEKEFLKKFLTK